MTLKARGELLATVLPELAQRREQTKRARTDRQRAVGGGAKRHLAPAQEVLRVRSYVRHNVAPEVGGHLFGVSAALSENLLHALVPRRRAVLPATRFVAEHRCRRAGPTLTVEKTDRSLLDSCETAIPRPAKPERQKRLYAGKTNRPTRKTQVVPDVTGEVLEVDAGQRGPAADKPIYEAREGTAHFPQAAKPADWGSLGTDGVETPQRKPRGGHLTAAQRAENRPRARVRVHVEQGIRRRKGFKIVRENDRPAIGLFPRVVAAVVGLVHLNRILL
jgi:hypothetical protein